MYRLLAIAVIAILLPAAANAQVVDQQRAELVGNCLVAMVDVEEEALFNNLVGAVVAEDAANATTFRTAIVARARDIGIERCNQPEDWFELPWAGSALGLYLRTMLVNRFTAALDWFQALP